MNAYNQEQTSFKKIKPVSNKQNQFQINKAVSKNQTALNIEPQHMFPAIELSI